jgi:hypothetical protein
MSLRVRVKRKAAPCHGRHGLPKRGYSGVPAVSGKKMLEQERGVFRPSGDMTEAAGLDELKRWCILSLDPGEIFPLAWVFAWAEHFQKVSDVLSLAEREVEEVEEEKRARRVEGAAMAVEAEEKEEKEYGAKRAAQGSLLARDWDEVTLQVVFPF